MRRVVLASLDASSFVGSGSLSSIVTLPSPRGALRSYLFCDGRLFEFSRAGVAPTAPCSWFVGDAVVSDGGLLVASPIDVIFFLLPLLSKGGAGGGVSFWSPASQFLRGDEAVLEGVRGVWERMSLLCETREGEAPGPDALVRLDKRKALGVLVGKVRRLARTLAATTRASASAATAARGVFAESSVMTSATTPSRTGEEGGSGIAPGGGGGASAVDFDAISLDAALTIFSEYVSPEWYSAVSDALGVVAGAGAAASVGGGGAAVVTQEAAASEPSKASQWNDVALHDPMEAIAKYVLGKRGGGDGVSKEKAGSSAKKTPTSGKLSAVKQKNVQPIGAFFSGGKRT